MDDDEAASAGAAGSEAERLTALLEQPEAPAPEAPNGDPNRKTGGDGRANAVRSADEAGPAERPVTGEEGARESDPAEGPAIGSCPFNAAARYHRGCITMPAGQS